MNGLKIKLIGLITVIIVFIISISAYVNFEIQKQMITLIARRDVAALAGTINTGIANAMLSNHKETINDILSQLKQHESIASIRIFDKAGKIVNSADPTEIGSYVHKGDLAFANSESSKLRQIKEGEYSFDSISNISNSPACYGCHPATRSIIGVLEIHLSLKYLTPLLDQIKHITLVSALLIIFLIFATITVFLVFYVDRPIRQLMTAMERVETGNFEPLDIRSSNEMKRLTDSFNIMVNKFRTLINATVRHERELAVAQEKLEHHHEIHLMNEKLEEQLKEIENLNVSLEERIEEIEEANYKIADLAGELEDKNTVLEKTVARLSTLYTVGMAINCTMELDRLFQLLVKTTMEAMNAQIGYILLHDKTHSTLNVTTLVGYENSTNITSLPMKPSSVSTWVIENRQPLLIQNMDSNPEFDRFSAIGYERKTLICVPLTTKDELIGTITVVNKLDNTVYTAEELELLTTIAAQAGIAIHNAKLYEEQQRNYLSTIQALVTAIEASDSYTRGHSERVTRYSVELARRMELPGDRIKVVERAAMLHDIGKIGIDLSLLHKEDKLTPEEVCELQQHPQIGMKILEPIKFLDNIRVCIGQHHERFDGQGYPARVPKDQLLVESRILAIADAYDAMTTNRPYRKAMSEDTAIRELLDNAGTQFDPQLVTAFVDLIRGGMLSPVEPLRSTKEEDEAETQFRVSAFS